VIRAVKAIEEADVCVLMIDATLGIEAQDMQLLMLIQRKKKGLVIVVNKWDLVQKETNTALEYERALKARIAPFNDVPVIFTSVLEKQRIFKLVESAIEVFKNRSKKIKTSQLNEVLLPEIEKFPPPTYRGKYIKIKYITQLPLHYPAFAFFCNHPKHVAPPYRNFLENLIRKHFNFTGVPIHIFFREK
jgi:GTP-binding protein